MRRETDVRKKAKRTTGKKANKGDFTIKIVSVFRFPFNDINSNYCGDLGKVGSMLKGKRGSLSICISTASHRQFSKSIAGP